MLLSIMPTTKWGLTANTVLPSASMLDPYLATKAALALAANGSSRTSSATPSTTTASLAPWVHTEQLGRPTRFLALRVGRPVLKTSLPPTHTAQTAVRWGVPEAPTVASQ